MKPLTTATEQFNHDMIRRLLTPSRGQPAVLTKVEGDALGCFLTDYTAARMVWGRDTEERDRTIDVQTVLSPTTYRFLMLVFSDGNGLESTEKECGLPARSGKVILKIAAEQLAPYYELA